MKLSDIGESFSVKLNKRTEEVGELISFFSVMLLFGTFLIGIAQFLSEHQVTIEGVKLLSYKADYLSTLVNSGAYIVGGCLIGLLGLLLHILLRILIHDINLRDYIVNGFLISAIGSILYGIFSFIHYMVVVSGQAWFIEIILATLIVTAIAIIVYYFYSALVRIYHLNNKIN